MEKVYDYQKLLDVYIEAQRERPAFAEEEHRTYYPRLLAQLESAFGVSISLESIREFEKQVLFRLFQSTALSCRDLRHPWSYFIEATLLIHRLEDQGEIGQRILAMSNEIRATTETSKRQHLEMLSDLFECIWGQNDKVITSHQLRELGFDDSKEPDWLDFV